MSDIIKTLPLTPFDVEGAVHKNIAYFRVEQRRVPEQMSMYGLAKKAGVEYQTLYKICKGKSSPMVNTFAKLAAALFVTMDELFYRYPPPVMYHHLHYHSDDPYALKELRDTTKISFEQAAKKAQIGSVTVYNIASGKQPRIKTLARLAWVFSISIETMAKNV